MNNTIAITADQIVLNKEAERFAVTPDKIGRIVEVANSIVLGDTSSAHSFGRNETSNNAYLDKLLDNVQVYNQGSDGKRLNEIIELAREISGSVQPGKTQQFLNRIPVLGHFVSRILRFHDRALDRFDSVKGQVDLLTTDISKISNSFIQRNVDLDIMYEEALAEVRDAGVNILAAGYAIKQIELALDERRKKLKEDNENNMLAIDVSNIDHQLTVMKKRRADIIMNQQKSFEDLTMIRMMQRNNLGMLDQFHTIQNVTLPSAKRGHLMVDQAEKSNAGSKLIEAVGDAVNRQARRQADLVRESSVRIARQAYRTVYDESTLEHITTTIGSAARELKRIHAENETQHLRIAERAETWMDNRRKMLQELSE